MLQIILLIFIFIAGILAGIKLREFTKEELKACRKWFKLLIIISLIIAVIILFLPIVFKLKLAYVLTLVLIAIISWISWRK